MAFSMVQQEGRLTLKLEGAVNIRHAQALADQLRKVEDGDAVWLDTESLEDIDTSVLQLLCSLKKTVRAVSFDRVSDVFVSAVDRCGLRRELLSAREEL